jgi:carbon monoxide dehydrogenase subunit G
LRLENTFEVARPPAEAWDILMDVPRIVGCVPGAELIAVEQDGSYKGSVAVKLGPVALKFLGNVRIDGNPETRTASVIARGADQKDRGNAGATTKISVVPAAAGSLVRLETDLQLSGMVAQYGRATGMISALSNEIIAQFAEALRAQLASPTGETAAGEREAKPKAASALGFATLWRAFIAWLKGKIRRPRDVARNSTR